MCMTTRTAPLIQRDISQGLEDIQAALRCKDIDLEYVENRLTSVKRSLAAAKNASDVYYEMIQSCFTSTLVQSKPTTTQISMISPMTKPYRPMCNKLNRARDIVLRITPKVVARKASFVLPSACKVLESGPSKL